MLNPSCSEAVYRLDKKVIANFKKKQMKVFETIWLKHLRRFSGSTGNFLKPNLNKNWWKSVFEDIDDDISSIKANKKEHFVYTPYFEHIELDLFLDYFKIPSKRNHWTDSGTTFMSRKKYNKYMKGFCKEHKLKYKKGIKKFKNVKS